ncbi:TonB-dependent siderophore receptor [Acetobacteraceae bacterium]|nr:TonB-dependent siderophore receptor [Acetobacteraceae bacterium]
MSIRLMKHYAGYLRRKIFSCPLPPILPEKIRFAPDAVVIMRGVAGICAVLAIQEAGTAKAAEASSQVKAPSQKTAGERVYVRGKKTDQQEAVANEVSGVKADYLNKEVDLGPLGKIPGEKAPFSVMSASHDVVENQQIRNMEDATEYMPSVQWDTANDSTSEIVNRGFVGDDVTNSRIDGLTARISAPYTSEQFDHLAVLNGMAGAMYGPMSPAGIMDMTLKRPTKQPFFNFNFGYDSNGAPLESGDFSMGKGPIKGRINLLNQTGQSYVANSNIWRDMISGDFDIQLNKRMKLELDASQYTIGVYGLPGEFAYAENVQLPSAPNAATPGYGQSNGGSVTSASMGMEKLFIDISRHWKAKLGGLYQDTARNTFNISNNIGSSSYCAGHGIDGSCYQQTLIHSDQNDNYMLWSNFAYLNGDFRTGLIHHQVNLGTNGYESNYDVPIVDENPIIIDTSPMYSPSVVHGLGQHPGILGQYHAGYMATQSLIAGDTMDIGRYFTVMGEFSWGWIRTMGFNPKGEETRHYDANVAFSPSVGMTFHPRKELNFYFNWGKSIQPGPVAPGGSANNGDILPLIRSEQFEGGLKWTVRKKLQINLDGFAATRPYAFDNFDDMINGRPVYGLFGSQHDYGIEYQMSGNLTRDLSILGGFTWDHAELENTGNPLTSHRKVTGVAPWQADILFDWRVPKELVSGLAFNANVHYVGTRAANVTNTTWADEYVTLDLGARYATKICDHNLVFRFTVDNVTQEQYWSSAFATTNNGAPNTSNEAALGLPRTWHLTASMYF